MSDVDKSAMLAEFFKANYKTMIAPSRRYNQLYQLKTKGITGFENQDWLDLQVWSNLAWIDPMFHNEKEIKYLLDKHEGFNEDDKLLLLDFQQKILAGIIPKYKEVAEGGQIELSVTPYFHPILPLLCDTDIASKAIPHISLPDNRLVHPEDARLQIQLAVEYFKNKFGFQPKGMWPSDGSVSEQIG